MKKENDEITDLFRTRLSHCELPVRDDFWHELEHDFPVVPVRWYKLHCRFAAVAAAFLALVAMSATLCILSSDKEVEKTFSQLPVIAGHSDVSARNSETKPLPMVIEPIPPKAVSTVVSPIAREEDSVSVSFSFSFAVSSRRDGSDSDRKAIDAYAMTINSSSEWKEGGDVEHAYRQPLIPQTPEWRRWTIAVSALAATSAVTKSAEGQAGTVIKHKMPVSVGLSIKRELTERFALEAGLNYTMLRSELSKDKGMTQEQKSHYLGIPLKASYILWKGKNVDLYVTGGGMVEKCVSAEQMDGTMGGSKTWQYSLMASAGVQYRVAKNVALFAEPGVAYHFDDGSPLPTVRHEKPTNFNLLCGIRVAY